MANCKAEILKYGDMISFFLLYFLMYFLTNVSYVMFPGLDSQRNCQRKHFVQSTLQ
jgi:hypothetical protein